MWAALTAAALGGACAAPDDAIPRTAAASRSEASTTTTVKGTTTSTTRPTTTAPPTTAPPTTAPPATPPPLPQRVVAETGWSPFATVGGVTLFHPAMYVERIGFHESNHDGAQQLDPLPTAVAPATLETRDRGTGSRTAADVVVDPEGEIRAPVTGTVKRAGGYVLYCDYSDDYVVIEPDEHPGWEVKILHIDGEQVTAGQRVVAGETVLAPHPTRLQFESQVDEIGTPPAWTHVHIEVVDPSIPDRPTPGGGCG